jgi:hypothetical protein
MIKASEAREMISKKNQVKKETFKAILESFMRKIKVALESNLKSVVLEIPIFVPGCPIFDRREATEYLARQLVRLGYNVDQLSPFAIYVTWSKRSEPEEISIAPSLMNVHKLAGELRRKNHR